MTGNRFILTPYYLDQHLTGLESLAEPDWHIINPVLSGSETQHRMAMLYESLAEYVSDSILSGFRPVNIAGDCCSTIGVSAGLQRAGVDFQVIWFDAHGDFNTWETTPSGFLGGMPLAMLVGRGDQTMPEAVGLQNLDEESVLLSDARDLDPDEKIALNESKVVLLKSVDELLQFRPPDIPLYVHFDVDILNPREASAVNYAATGGPSADELQEAFHHLARTRNIRAISMSSWNPELDENGHTREVCMKSLEALLGDDP